MLKSLAGAKVVDVPYKGLPQAVTDLMGGQVQFVFADYAAAFSQIKAGRLKGLGLRQPRVPREIVLGYVDRRPRLQRADVLDH